MALDRTRANIQYHLSKLEAEGLIEKLPSAALPAQPGRPRHFFVLSVRARPTNLVGLADALLKQLFSTEKTAEQSTLDQLAQRLFPLSLPISLTLTQRLNRVVKELSSRGYQARWEARPAGPQVEFRNCPYAALLPLHPELCQLDAAVLKLLTACQVEQRMRMQLPKEPACLFQVRPASSPKPR